MNKEVKKQAEGVSDEEKLLETIKLYMGQHAAHNLDAREVAAKLDISILILNRIFRKFLGQSYLQYRVAFRMHEAMKLIRKGIRVKAVMQATGYKYRSTFNRNFKRFHQYPPSYFRSHKQGKGKRGN